MHRGVCPRHAGRHPCTCAMGNLYRFLEPVVLFLLEKKGCSYGYELASELRRHALTDAEVEGAALYKILRQLEKNDCVTSTWKVEGSGPARRVYELTTRGRQHLGEWVAVLDHMSKAMARFVRNARAGGRAVRPGRMEPSVRAGSSANPVELARAPK